MSSLNRVLSAARPILNPGLTPLAFESSRIATQHRTVPYMRLLHALKIQIYDRVTRQSCHSLAGAAAKFQRIGDDIAGISLQTPQRFQSARGQREKVCHFILRLQSLPIGPIRCPEDQCSRTESPCCVSELSFATTRSCSCPCVTCCQNQSHFRIMVASLRLAVHERSAGAMRFAWDVVSLNWRSGDIGAR